MSFFINTFYIVPRNRVKYNLISFVSPVYRKRVENMFFSILTLRKDAMPENRKVNQISEKSSKYGPETM